MKKICLIIIVHLIALQCLSGNDSPSFFIIFPSVSYNLMAPKLVKIVTRYDINNPEFCYFQKENKFYKSGLSYNFGIGYGYRKNRTINIQYEFIENTLNYPDYSKIQLINNTVTLNINHYFHFDKFSDFYIGAGLGIHRFREKKNVRIEDQDFNESYHSNIKTDPGANLTLGLKCQTIPCLFLNIYTTYHYCCQDDFYIETNHESDVIYDHMDYWDINKLSYLQIYLGLLYEFRLNKWNF